MHLTTVQLPKLATRLMAERKRQGLSRSQAAAVCNVSTSFIRDAESAPERCSFGKLLLLIRGLGLSLEVTGWPDEGILDGVSSQATAMLGPPPAAVSEGPAS